MRNHAYDMEVRGPGWRCTTCTARLCRCVERTETGAWEPICPNCKRKKNDTFEEKCNCGRPTKYSSEILTLTEAYIDQCGHREETYIVGLNYKKMETFATRTVIKVPSIEGLSVYIHVNKSTIQDWREKYSPFSLLIDEMLALQGEMLIDNGLSGTYNSTIAKVLLTKHGYREGIDTTSNDKTLAVDPEAKKKTNTLIDKFLGNK